MIEKLLWSAFIWGEHNHTELPLPRRQHKHSDEDTPADTWRLCGHRCTRQDCQSSRMNCTPSVCSMCVMNSMASSTVQTQACRNAKTELKILVKAHLEVLLDVRHKLDGLLHGGLGDHHLAHPGGQAVAAADHLLARFHQRVRVQHVWVVLPLLRMRS